MYVPRDPGLYRDVTGDYWSLDDDGWRWIGRRLPFTGEVVPADPGHGPLRDRELAMLVDSPDDAVLPLERIKAPEHPPESWPGKRGASPAERIGRAPVHAWGSEARRGAFLDDSQSSPTSRPEAQS